MIANELLDNLPTRLLERTHETWKEVGVDDDLTEVLLPTTLAPAIGDDVVPGSRSCGRRPPHAGFGRARRGATGGRVRLHDDDGGHGPASVDRLVAHLPGHDRGRDPLVDLGSQDITCEVAIDQLAAVHEPVSVRDQRAFLTEHGIDELVQDGRAAWERGAAEGGLEAIRGRSRVREAEALTDIGGLGAFYGCRVEAMNLYDADRPTTTCRCPHLVAM